MNYKLNGFKQHLDDLEITEAVKTDYFQRVSRVINLSPHFDYQHVSKFVKSKSPANRNKYVSALHAFGKFRGWKWLKKIKRKKEVAKPPGLLADDEIESAIKQYLPGSRDWMFILLFSFTAARPSEIVKLRRENINLIEDTITFWHTKNGENRRIVIPKRVRSQLHEYMGNLKTDYLFPTLNHPDRHISVLTCRGLFYKALNNVNINVEVRKQRGIKFYHLKHSCITRLKQGGVDIVEMKDITGHKKLDSLLHYYKGDLVTMDKNYDKDRMAKKFLDPKERYKQLVEALMELDKDLEGDDRLESVFSKSGDEVQLKIKLMSEETSKDQK